MSETTLREQDATAVRARITARAKSNRRRVREGLGIKANALDGVTAELLWHYADTAARRDVLPPSTELVNSTARALHRLEQRLREVGLAPGRDAAGGVRAYLDSAYGGNGGA